MEELNTIEYAVEQIEILNAELDEAVMAAVEKVIQGHDLKAAKILIGLLPFNHRLAPFITAWAKREMTSQQPNALAKR